MKFRVVETFFSLQGEGLYVGTPSVFLRLFGCNFTCPGFGADQGLVARESVDPESVRCLSDLPINVRGCDSYPAWDKRFRHLSQLYSPETLANILAQHLPSTVNQRANQHLVITGGEPLLGWQKIYPVLLSHEKLTWFKTITFETNATQTLSDDFFNWMSSSSYRWLFSCSPKLSNSGESWTDSIKPSVLKQYTKVPNSIVVLKFVVRSEACLPEVKKAISEYKSIGFNGDVFLMPEGATAQAYRANATMVSELALAHGFKYSPRLHNDLWGNAWSK